VAYTLPAVLLTGPETDHNERTRPMFEIVGVYDGEKEVVDTAETQEDADYLLQEYQIAFGLDWILTIEGPPVEYGRIY